MGIGGNIDNATSAGGTVTSVAGTANRITVTTGTTAAVVDISSAYVGQNTITTLGTITTGVWNGTIITSGFGGTGNGFTKFSGPATSEKTFTLPNSSDTIMTLASGGSLSSGYSQADSDQGTKSSGTFTPVETAGNMQRCVNGGAFTLAPPTNNTQIMLEVTNNGSAGTITTSGFTKVVGDALTTVNGSIFQLFITKFNAHSTLNVIALQ